MAKLILLPHTLFSASYTYTINAFKLCNFWSYFYKGKQHRLLSMLRKCLALIHGILRKVPIFRLTYWILYNDKMPQRINQWKMKKKMWAVGKILSLNWTWKSKKRTFLPSCLLGQREGERQREEQTTKRLVEILLVSLTGIYFHIILAGKCTLSGWLVAWSNTPFIRLRCINGCTICKRSNIAHINRNTIQWIRGIWMILLYQEATQLPRSI